MLLASVYGGRHNQTSLTYEHRRLSAGQKCTIWPVFTALACLQGRKADLISRLTAALGTTVTASTEVAEKANIAKDAALAEPAPANGLAPEAQESADELAADAAAAEAAEENLAEAIEQEALAEAEDEIPFDEPVAAGSEEADDPQTSEDEPPLTVAQAATEDGAEPTGEAEVALQDEVGQGAEDAIEAVADDTETNGVFEEEEEEEKEVGSFTRHVWFLQRFCVCVLVVVIPVLLHSALEK